MRQVDNSDTSHTLIYIGDTDMAFNKMSIDDLAKKAEELNGGGNEQKSYKDERLWKPTVDKSGNGYAVIRFLPPINEESIPWVRYWDHGFKGPTGKWYIEKSLTSIGQQDPLGEANSKLWNTGLEEDKQLVRQRKRRLHYVSNIYVISDPANPENEGKVFLYQYGKKIFDKIMDMMKPEFQDEEPVNPFHPYEGADFKLKIRNVEGYRNYDKSEFAVPGPLLGGDEDELGKVEKAIHPLYEFIDPKQYKSYEELKQRLDLVLGTDSGNSVSVQEGTEASPMREASGPQTYNSDPNGMFSDQEKAADPVSPPAATNNEGDSEDDTLSYFAKLASQE